MKYATIEVYKDHGKTQRRLIQVGDNCKPMSEYHDDYDYYLDVHSTKAEAVAHFNGHPFNDETH